MKKGNRWWARERNATQEDCARAAFKLIAYARKAFPDLKADTFSLMCVHAVAMSLATCDDDDAREGAEILSGLLVSIVSAICRERNGVLPGVTIQ